MLEEGVTRQVLNFVVINLFVVLLSRHSLELLQTFAAQTFVPTSF